jgi:hypothetical protein
VRIHQNWPDGQILSFHSDPLKESLDSYAKLHNLGISMVVQQALSLLLTPDKPTEPPPHQPAPNGHIENRLETIAQCLQAFAQHHELIRAAVEKLARNTSTAIYVPPAFPEIPW